MTLTPQNRTKALTALVDAGYTSTYAAELLDELIGLATKERVPGMASTADVSRAGLIVAKAFTTNDIGTAGKLRILVEFLRAISSR